MQPRITAFLATKKTPQHDKQLRIKGFPSDRPIMVCWMPHATPDELFPFGVPILPSVCQDIIYLAERIQTLPSHSHPALEASVSADRPASRPAAVDSAFEPVSPRARDRTAACPRSWAEAQETRLRTSPADHPCLGSCPSTMTAAAEELASPRRSGSRTVAPWLPGTCAASPPFPASPFPGVRRASGCRLRWAIRRRLRRRRTTLLLRFHPWSRLSASVCD